MAPQQVRRTLDYPLVPSEVGFVKRVVGRGAGPAGAVPPTLPRCTAPDGAFWRGVAGQPGAASRAGASDATSWPTMRSECPPESRRGGSGGGAPTSHRGRPNARKLTLANGPGRAGRAVQSK